MLLEHPMQPFPQIMGILNITPDSFSDGGQYQSEAALLARIEQLLSEGVDCIDVGGESTRPGAEAISMQEELARVLPAIRAIRARSTVDISIDTTKAKVAEAALAAGANIINDVSALIADREMIQLVCASTVPVIIMHRQGTPADMQHAPHYRNVVEEINAFLAQRIAWMENQGVNRGRIIVDPGIGFGKTLEHNLAILRQIKAFKQHSCPVLIGHSRKSFLAQLLDIPPEERDCPTAMLSLFCALHGADLLRVHNVKASRQAIRLAQALKCNLSAA